MRRECFLQRIERLVAIRCPGEIACPAQKTSRGGTMAEKFLMKLRSSFHKENGGSGWRGRGMYEASGQVFVDVFTQGR